MAGQKAWIKLNDWKQVQFPNVCPYSGLEVNTVKEYIVENTSLLWIILRVLRVGQYIDINVPFNDTGLQKLKKVRRKAILKGLLVGFVIAILSLVIGVFFMHEAGHNKKAMDLVIIITGCTFAFSLLLNPFIFLWSEHLKSGPMYFRKNGTELWVKARNVDYRKRFIELNEQCILEKKSTNQEVLDAP